MEGISGVSNFKEMDTQQSYVSKMMTAEVRSVCEAINRARAGDHEVEIVVADSHSLGVNINPCELPENVKLIRGFPRHYYMMPAIDKTYDAVFFVGHHAKIGTPDAGMDHTFSGSAIFGVEINGAEVGEFEINAGLAGHYGVAVAYASGDDKFIAQISGLKQKHGFVTLVTKEALSRYCAALYHPEKVRRDISAMVEKSLVEKKWKSKPLRYDYPLKVTVTFANTVKTDMVSMIPVLKRLDGRTIYFEAPDFPYFYNMLCAMTLICWNDR